jgi:PAS domain S-box-containing protein
MSLKFFRSGAIAVKPLLFLAIGSVFLAVLIGFTSFLAFRGMEAAAAARTRGFETLRVADALISTLNGYRPAAGSILPAQDEIGALLQGMGTLSPVAARDRLNRLTELFAARPAESIPPIDSIHGNASDPGAVKADRSRASWIGQLGAFVAAEKRKLGMDERSFRSNAEFLFASILSFILLIVAFAASVLLLFSRNSPRTKKEAGRQKTDKLMKEQALTTLRLQEANDVLRGSEEKLAVTLNSIGDAVIVTDVQARISRMNPIAEQLTGWMLGEAIGRPVQEVFNILNQETRQVATIPVMATLAHGVIQGLANHTLLISRNGTERSISDSCAPIRDKGGKVIGAILVFRDVTKAYELEQALHDGTTQIQTILDTVIDGIISFDPNEGSIVNVNPAVTTMFGFGPDELIGTRFASLIPEFSAGRADKSLDSFRVSEDNRKIGIIREASGRRKDGSVFPLEISVGEMRLGQRRLITAILRDVSARRHAEDALLKASALQNAIFKSVTFSIIATDLNGKIQIFNVGAERMLGYPAEDLLDKTFPVAIFDPLESIKRAVELSEELHTTVSPGFEALSYKASCGIEDIFELNFLRRDGGRFPALMSVSALRDVKGGIIGFLLIGTDITSRRTIEKEKAALFLALQEKNAELQIARIAADRANHAKSDFLSSMSHELRTPLSAILGFAQLIESGAPAPTASQKRSIEQILKAGWYLLELINEILDLALIESGKLSLSLEPVSLSELLLECQIMVGIQAKKRNIALSFMGFDNQLTVRADRTRLKQIIINLLTNAIKYNRENGTVSVAYTQRSPDSIRISVTDTGEGLAAEQVAHLFEPFNRLGKETSGEEGTGIGLVVCKRLIELMGGTIGTESAIGSGSTFWIEMSLNGEPSQALSPFERKTFPVLADRGEGPEYTLLYVEDNPANLMLVEDLISRRKDIRMLSATDGYQGIEIARSALPDVILMDINLPGINGIEALKILLKDPNTAHIPIIALSANAIPRDIEKGLAAGFFRYLTKPIKVNEFMQTLDHALIRAKALYEGK